ncbi:MAG: BMP family ABC transporter substrate-binding protein [Acidimicrobiales bacterium]
MKQRESMSSDLSAEWQKLHGRQLDLRRQLAANPSSEERAVLIAHFRANRELLQAIEQGDEASDHHETETDAETDLAEALASIARDHARDQELNVDDHADYDADDDLEDNPENKAKEEHAEHRGSQERGTPSLDSVPDLDGIVGAAPEATTTEIVAVRPRPRAAANDSGVRIGGGYAALVALAALIVAIGGVIVVSRNAEQADDSTVGQAGSGPAQQLGSSAVGVQQEAQLLRARVDELGVSGVSIDVDDSGQVVVLAGTVASDAERQQVIETAQSIVLSAEIDTSGVVLADQAAAGTETATSPVPLLPVRRIAVITPDARTDFSFSQSMADSIDAFAVARGNVEVTIVEGARGAEAVAAIRQHATDGFDLVIAHSSGFRPAVDTVAAEFPNVTFAVGTIIDEPVLPNVYTYNVGVEDGGAILGAAAARATTSGVVGVVGPVPVGTSKRYLDAFEAGVKAESPGTTVIVTYTGSLNDPAGAAAATQSLIDAGADVIAGQGHYLNDAVAVAEAAGVLWVGNHVDQQSLGPSTVLASQVYHWDVVIDRIVADLDAGLVDGRNLTADYSNGGLSIEVNPGTGRSETIQATVDQLIAEASAP